MEVIESIYLFKGGVNILQLKQALTCGVNSRAGRYQGNTIYQYTGFQHYLFWYWYRSSGRCDGSLLMLRPSGTLFTMCQSFTLPPLLFPLPFPSPSILLPLTPFFSPPPPPFPLCSQFPVHPLSPQDYVVSSFGAHLHKWMAFSLDMTWDFTMQSMREKYST